MDRERVKFHALLIGMFIVGVAFILISSPVGLLEKVGEALLISVILAVTVDTYLKRKITHEVAQGISKYLIGWELPKEIQDRVQSLIRTELVRRQYQVNIRLTREALDTEVLQFEIEESFEVENVTDRPIRFTPTLWALKGEKIVGIYCESCNKKLQYALEAEKLNIRDGEDGESYAIGRCVKIPPRGDDGKFGCRFRFKLKGKTAIAGGYTLPIRVPTLGGYLNVECPQEMRVFLFPTEGRVSETSWRFGRFFGPGEALRAQWRPACGDERLTVVQLPKSKTA